MLLKLNHDFVQPPCQCLSFQTQSPVNVHHQNHFQRQTTCELCIFCLTAPILLGWQPFIYEVNNINHFSFCNTAIRTGLMQFPKP
jgi:hypothetical protein